MSNYEIRNATEEDAVFLSSRLRSADIDEIKAIGEYTPLEALLTSFKNSAEPKAALIDDTVVAMFGVAAPSLVSEHGVPWLLSSENTIRRVKPFLKISRDYISGIKKKYTYLSNFVDTRNTDSIKWLRRLGFNILPAQKYGASGFMFHKFTMSNKKTTANGLRYEDWADRLDGYIISKAFMPFSWASNNCGFFVSGGLKAMYGMSATHWLDGKIGSKRDALREASKMGCKSFCELEEKVLDEILVRQPAGQEPVYGDVVMAHIDNLDPEAVGRTIGLVDRGGNMLVPGKEGLVAVDISRKAVVLWK